MGVLRENREVESNTKVWAVVWQWIGFFKEAVPPPPHTHTRVSGASNTALSISADMYGDLGVTCSPDVYFNMCPLSYRRY